MPTAVKRNVPSVDFSPKNEKARFVISGIKRGEQLEVDSDTLNFEINKRAGTIGQYNVDYEDTNEEHEVHVKYAAQHIPGSPFTMPGSPEEREVMSTLAKFENGTVVHSQEEKAAQPVTKLEEVEQLEEVVTTDENVALTPKVHHHNGENTFSVENVPEADKKLKVLGGIGFEVFSDLNKPDLVHVDYKLNGIQDVEVKYGDKAVEGGFFTLVPHHLREKYEQASTEEREMMKTLSAFENGRVVHSQEEKAPQPKVEEIMAAPVQQFDQENFQRGRLVQSRQLQQQQMAQQEEFVQSSTVKIPTTGTAPKIEEMAAPVQQFPQRGRLVRSQQPQQQMAEQVQQQQVVMQQEAPQRVVLRSQPAQYHVVRRQGM